MGLGTYYLIMKQEKVLAEHFNLHYDIGVPSETDKEGQACYFF